MLINIICIFQITLVDRSLMPGDVIRRMISGKSSQRGYVQDLSVRCHLFIKGTNKYIYDVDAKDLKPLRVSKSLKFFRFLYKMENV